MPELRWILLVLGALLIGGLWWWELRRSRQPGPPAIPAIDHEPRTTDRFEPRLDGGAAAESVEIPPSRVAEERPIPRGDPPVVMFHDLPEDADRVVLAREPVAPRRSEPVMPPTPRREPAVAPDSWPDEDVVPDLDSVRTEATRVEPRLGTTPPSESRTSAPRTPFGRREPSIQTTADVGRETPPPVLAAANIAAGTRLAGAAAAPTSSASTAAHSSGAEDSTHAPSAAPTPGAGAPSGSGGEARRPAPRAAVAPRPASPPAVSPEASKKAAPAEPPATLQRIVAIRLVGAGGERFDGGALRAALEAEGMRFGKYSIFHRQRSDGRTLYSVASLVEPGSFDLDRMHTLEFPGVSMFAVFPGPLDAPAIFDELLATARRLAGRLDGVLQDERGGPLSAQRALGIRDELVSFQNLVTRVRSRPAG